MPKRKIANQPGYELKENPETGVRRWHAVTKKRINPETGEVFEEPALFEELPDPQPEEFWAARAYLKHRGIEFYDGGGEIMMDLPEPEDIANKIDANKFVGVLSELVKGGRVRLPDDFGEWLEEAGIVDDGFSLDKDVAKALLKEALEREDHGLGSFVSLGFDNEDEIKEMLMDMFLGHELEFIEGYGSGVEEFARFSSVAERVIDPSIVSELEDELINNPNSNILINEGYNERVIEFNETRYKARDELIGVLGASSFDEALKILKDDPTALHKWGERLIEEIDPESNYTDETLEYYAKSVREVLEIHDGWIENGRPGEAGALRKKYAEYLRGIHEEPALSTNRLSSTAVDILRNEGEYVWRRGDAEDDRVKREDLYGLGRVGYAALAYENAIPVIGGADKVVQLDPNTLALGTGGWGKTRMLWTPKELVDEDGGGLSWSFDDFYYDPEFGDYDNRPFWLTAALSGLNHSVRDLAGYQDDLPYMYSGLAPTFTEMHFARPLSVEEDLKKVLVPIATAPLDRTDPKDFAKNIVYDKFVGEEYGSVMAEDIPSSADLFLVNQMWGEWFGDDFVYDAIGETKELLDNEFGDRVKLWLPKSLKN